MIRSRNTGRSRTLISLFAGLCCVLALFQPRTAVANGEVGTVAPNFTINNVLAGPTPVTLGQYAGSVVVIAFFAEW